MRQSDDRNVKIFDTTLRDGQQCPGAGMSYDNNFRHFELTMGARIDVVEAGFPAAGKLDYQIVNEIAETYAREKACPIIAALCQLRSDQVDTTIEALLPAVPFEKARLHVYVPVAPRLMAASLGEERAANKIQLVRDVHTFVARAAAAGLEVEFSPEGYSSQGENFDFVTDLICSAVDAGASVINCPDTIGGAHHFQGKQYFVEMMKEHAAIVRLRYPHRQVTWSTHCHDDFGLAVENSMNAVFMGPARQIEATINGIGERAGNAQLERCVMIIKHFGALRNPENPLYTNVKTERLKALSDFAAEHMLPRQPHFPIVGENAARHSSGGHTNAILKDPLAYQPFHPEEVGTVVSFLFGPLSGGNHAKSIVENAGYVCEENEKARFAQFVKELYKERRKGITDREVIEGYIEYRKPMQIEHITYSKKSGEASVTITGRFFDVEGETTETIFGEDSAMAALKSLIDKKLPGFNVQSYKSASEDQGIHATSIASIVLCDEQGDAMTGRGQDQDIEIAAMKALVDAANRMYVQKNFRKK